MKSREKRRNRYGYLAALAVCFMLLPLPTIAQGFLQLDLKAALSYALKANQQARKARMDVENTEHQIAEVRSRALPQLNGAAGVTNNPLLQKSALPNIFGPNPNPNETILVAFGQKWNANAGVTLSQAIFDKSVLTGLDAARASREFFRLSMVLTEEQVIEQVAINYYQVLVQRQQLHVLDTTIANTERVYDVLRGQFESGLARKIDVDRMSVNISNLKSQRQQLSNGLSLLENQLKFYMGMPINTPVEIVNGSTAKPELDAAFMETVPLKDRTEFKLLKQQERLLRLQKQAFEAEYYPSLALSGNYAYMGLGQRFPLFRGPSNGVNWFGVSSVSLNLRVPLFNGFATRSRVRQASVGLRKLQEDIDNTSLALDLAFENAKTQIKNSIVTLQAQEKNVRLAGDVYTNTQNNYNNGLATLTDLLNAETSLMEANNNYATAMLHYRLAEIQLIKSQGKLTSLINTEFN